MGKLRSEFETGRCCGWGSNNPKYDGHSKMQAPYQIFRKLPGNRFVWVENVYELQEARGRLAALSSNSEVDYVLFDPRERSVVSRYAKTA